MSTSVPSLDLDALIACYLADPAMTQRKWVEWACDCAERVLPAFQSQYPDDARPAQAIVAARQWVDNPSDTTTRAAADATHAAYAAAHAAACATHYTAAHAAYAATHAAGFATHAAGFAAGFAADYSAYAIYTAVYATKAKPTERLWQAVRLTDIYHKEQTP